MSKVHGRTLGLKNPQVRALERLLHRKVDAERAVTHELARELARLASDAGRCLGIVVDRRGRVLDVSLGDAHGAPFPTRRLARNTAPGRLCGLRFVRTAFSTGGFGHDELAMLSRHRLDALVKIEVGRDGSLGSLRTATLLPPGSDKPFDLSPPFAPTAIRADFLESLAALEEEFARTAPGAKAAVDRDRAILVTVSQEASDPARESLEELRELARSSGIEVADARLQRRDRIDPATVMGRGFLEEVTRRAASLGAGLLVVDGELTPRQAKNLEVASGLEVMDRTMLILEIFGRRARTRDGKIRVDLARLQYMTPHLIGRGIEMSRLGGLGGGAKGAVRGLGEQKLELDRRVLRRRIDHLKEEIEKIGRRRGEMRRHRAASGIAQVSIVGYTNAGKSTLFNALASASVRVEDLLFATLETTARRCRLPHGTEVVFLDTVGFIRDLPEGLRDAFRATLEEIDGSDLIVHLADAANEACPRQLEAVERTLGELHLEAIPRITVFNKRDRIPDAALLAPLVDRKRGMLLCALDPADVRALAARIERALAESVAERLATPAPDRDGDEEAGGSGRGAAEGAPA
ncbi:MAG TPA: GTPase HflX [Planctomycetota bacterium]|nr:GTPase HflX [Planctomycetota bacterium]